MNNQLNNYINYDGPVQVLIQEYWRYIPGTDNRYMISTFGNIWDCSLNKYTPQCQTPDGYKSVSISIDGIMGPKRVHRLVMLTFFPIEHPENYVVNHIDAVKSNNCILNLEWCTTKENCEHAASLGLYKSGEGHPNSYLTENEVRFICKSLEECKSYDYIINHILEGNSNYDYMKIKALISCIKRKISYTNISKDYNIDNKVNNSIYTREFLDKLCRCLENGYTFQQIILEMDIPESEQRKLKIFINSLFASNALYSVTSNYNIKRPSDIRAKHYSNDDIVSICTMIKHGMSADDILLALGYDVSTMDSKQKHTMRNSIYNIKEKVTFKNISDKYL